MGSENECRSTTGVGEVRSRARGSADAAPQWLTRLCLMACMRCHERVGVSGRVRVRVSVSEGEDKGQGEVSMAVCVRVRVKV